MRREKRSRGAGAACLVLIAVALNASVLFLNPTISKNLSFSVDFAASTGKNVAPVWRALNIWDISQVPDELANVSAFKARYPAIDTIVLMTATGGRPNWSWYTLSNDYVYRYPNGTLWYDFTDLFKATDLIVAAGYKIVLVIGNVPHALANKTTFTVADYGAFEALTLPPANYTEYAWYIGNLTAACVARYGLPEVSSWEFRLMTEPDNRDWWTATVGEYISLWLATFGPLKARVPGARVVFGNQAWHDDLAFLQTVLQGVKAANTTLLPDTVSFSYYHGLRDAEPPGDLRQLVARWEAFLAGMQLGKPVDITCEEGMILVDEDGTRLWGGDGTELGAAWDAWMLASVEGTSFRRFVQWSPQYDGWLGPRNYVHLAGERMAGMRLVSMEPQNAFLLGPFLRVGGFAAKNETAGTYRAMLYQYSPVRGKLLQPHVDLAITGLPPGTYNVTEYRIDPVHHNWFNAWLAASTGLTPRPDCSRWDLSIGSAYEWSEMAATWAAFKATHADPKRLEATSWNLVSVGPDGRASRRVLLDANCVVYLEIDRL
ncbi:MAG: hypothetical protein Q6373_011670 [Candidatus Sigynarchaeota archaeon]